MLTDINTLQITTVNYVPCMSPTDIKPITHNAGALTYNQELYKW